MTDSQVQPLRGQSRAVAEGDQQGGQGETQGKVR